MAAGTLTAPIAEPGAPSVGASSTPATSSAAPAAGTLTSALQPVYTQAPPQASVATVDPSAQIQQILAAFQPQATQSQMNLNDALAAAGISGGGAVGATQQLQGQLAGGLGNSLAAAIASANSGNQQAENQGNEFNVSNLINANNGNVSTANEFEQYLASLQNQDYLANNANYTGLLQSGLGAQQGINSQYASNYVVPQGTANGLGSLGSAVGNYFGSASPASSGSSAYGGVQQDPFGNVAGNYEP